MEGSVGGVRERRGFYHGLSGAWSYVYTPSAGSIPRQKDTRFSDFITAARIIEEEDPAEAVFLSVVTRQG